MTSKKKYYLFSLLIIIFSCAKNTKEKVLNSSIIEVRDSIIKLRKLNNLFVIGDFDGDKKQDTIFQHNYSKRTRTEIEKSPDLFQYDWDTVIDWFNSQDSDVYLTINKKNQDTLHLGVAQGLYCLINIGDNNTDGKDEIALVIDKLDISRVNNCEIYSLRNKKWKELMQFGIREDSFDFNTDQEPIFSDIKGYLEKQNNKWFYTDYSQDSYKKEDEVGKMKQLKINRCN